MKTTLCVAFATALAAVDATRTLQRTRLLRSVASQAASSETFQYSHATKSAETASTLEAQATGNQPSQYTFAAPNGNGPTDLSSPLYGSYAHNYGPVSQLLTATSGYGGFPSSIDPRGFNAQTQNYTAGAINLPEGSPTQKGSAGQGLFQPAVLGAVPVPGQTTFPNGGYIWGNVASGSLLNRQALTATGAVYAGMPVPGHPYLNNGVKLVPTSGAITGSIPVVYPNGVSKGVAPAVSAALGMGSSQPVQLGHISTAGTPFPALASPFHPSYQSNTMLHHQLTLGGSTFGAPGFFHPTAQSYPSPDADKYNSVALNPVLPPNYGNEHPAAAAKPAA